MIKTNAINVQSAALFMTAFFEEAKGKHNFKFLVLVVW